MKEDLKNIFKHWKTVKSKHEFPLKKIREKIEIWNILKSKKKFRKNNKRTERKTLNPVSIMEFEI